ncbi:MAG TPA: hypothetical protein VJQ54_21385 [Candidatus Sulfotelmatobacter sp.]|nr:hypothetical protein [Candidatus Sulfotelmatobacter sp.]
MIQTASTLEVVWTAPHNLVQPLTFSAGDVTIAYGDKGASFSVSNYIDTDGLVPLAGDPASISFTLKLSPEITPGASEQSFTITIRNVRYSGNPSPSPMLTATGTIYSKSNISALVKATQSALAVAKTTQEKDLFAGLNVSVPSNSNGGVSGDLAYNYSVTSVPKELQNSPLYDSGNVGLHINMGSTTKADARHFDLGISARKTILFVAAKDLQSIADGIANRSTSPMPSSAVVAALNRAQDHFWKAALVDYGFQMEADASTQGIGNVSNALFDLRPQIATSAESFSEGKGYFSLRLMPVGAELGHNLAKPTGTTGNIGGVARLKTAADINLAYKNSAANAFIESVALTSTTLYRHLFDSEMLYNPTTSTSSSTTKGNEFWNQTQFSIYSSRTYGKVRPGLSVTYMDGALPPVFNKVHTFTYGIVFQSIE